MSDNESDVSFVSGNSLVDSTTANECWEDQRIEDLSESEELESNLETYQIAFTEEATAPSTQDSVVRSRRSFFESKTPSGSIENLAPQAQKATRSNTKINENSILPLEEADSSLRNYRSNKNKMADAKEVARYQLLQQTHHTFKRNLEAEIVTIEADYNTEDKGESEIEKLEGHLATLESRRSSFKRKMSILIDTIDRLEYESQVENFANLEDSYTVTEASITRWIEKLKKAIKKFETDSVVSNKQRLECPTFEGDCLKFKTFKTRFQNFCKGFGEQDKKMHLIQALKGPAAEKVQDLIDRDRDFKTIWESIVSSYGNEKKVIDATCQSFYSLDKPQANNAAVSAYYDAMKNRASNVVDLGLDLDHFLAQYILAQLPGVYRADLMNKYDPKETKITVASIGPKLEEVFINRNYKEPDKVSCNIGTTELNVAAANTRPPASNPEQKVDHGNKGRGFDRGRGRGGYRGFRGRGRGFGQPSTQRPLRPMHCFICDREGHLARFCATFKQGAEIRKKLQEIGRCDACLALESEHTGTCHTVAEFCNFCGSHGHYSVTCDGVGKTHPGSWILNKKGISNSSHSR